MGNRSKQRRLGDLYVMGTPVEVTGRLGDVTTVWVQKLDPVDHDTCVRKAKAARARARASYRDTDSEEYLDARDTVESIPRETLIETIISPEVDKIRESVRAELSMGEDSEWAKDDYLSGLYDEWGDALSARYEEDPDDPEALRVLAEFERFEAALKEALDPQVDELRTMWTAADESALQEKALEVLIERQLQERWLEEFVRSEVWLATREACEHCLSEIDEARRRIDAGEPPQDAKNLHQDPHPRYYFVDRVEVDRLPPHVRSYLEAVYMQVAVDATEGKDLPETGASSGSSDSSEAEETPASSGPAAVPA
jgi:hypothetical protein